MDTARGLEREVNGEWRVDSGGMSRGGGRREECQEAAGQVWGGERRQSRFWVLSEGWKNRGIEDFVGTDIGRHKRGLDMKKSDKNKGGEQEFRGKEGGWGWVKREGVRGPERVWLRRSWNWEESSSGEAGNGAVGMRGVSKTAFGGDKLVSLCGEEQKERITKGDGQAIEERNSGPW
jgi:hypothetical protein